MTGASRLNHGGNKVTLVLGASGCQGGAVARALLERGSGHAVRVLARDPGAPRIASLAREGAQIYAGNWNDLDSLVRAMEGVDAVFAVTASSSGPAAEVRHGARIIQAANLAGVPQFIYSSAAGADRGSGVPFFESKHRIERRIRAVGLAYTILAPVFFMENYRISPLLDGLRRGRLEMPLAATLPFQQLAVGDLAACVRAVLDRPEGYLRARIELASDEVSGGLSAEILSFAMQVPLVHLRIPLERVAATQGAAYERLYQWIEEESFRVDMEASRIQFPEVRFHSLTDWALGQDWRALGIASRRDRLSRLPLASVSLRRSA